MAWSRFLLRNIDPDLLSRLIKDAKEEDRSAVRLHPGGPLRPLRDGLSAVSGSDKAGVRSNDAAAAAATGVVHRDQGGR